MAVLWGGHYFVGPVQVVVGTRIAELIYQRVAGRQPRHRTQQLYQEDRMGSLLIETVGNDPFRDLVAGKRSTHRDQGDLRKLQTNGRKQLETRHARHVQIGDDEVGKTGFHLKQSRHSIASRSHTISGLR